MNEIILFKLSSEDKKTLQREAKRNRMNVSAYIRQRLFVHNYISEVSQMKESINITSDAVQKKKLIEEAHKRNLSLKEYLRLLVE